jgi:hypothetical protein
MVIFHSYVKLPEGMGIEPIKEVIDPWDPLGWRDSDPFHLFRTETIIQKHMNLHEMIIPT